MQRFSDGYISLADLTDVEVAISPEFERMARHMNKIVTATRTLDMSKRQAQYRALQNQINPHFLYNTLEGIRSEAIMAGLDNLADMTEAGRNFIDVHTLRAAVNQNLNLGMYYALKISIANVLDKGGLLPRHTIEAYNQYVQIVAGMKD